MKVKYSLGRQFVEKVLLYVFYRASHVLGDLGWVDLDLGSSPGWWAATVATYCPSRVVEHSKSKSTKPSPRAHGTPCTLGIFYLTKAVYLIFLESSSRTP